MIPEGLTGLGLILFKFLCLQTSLPCLPTSVLCGKISPHSFETHDSVAHSDHRRMSSNTDWSHPTCHWHECGQSRKEHHLSQQRWNRQIVELRWEKIFSSKTHNFIIFTLGEMKCISVLATIGELCESLNCCDISDQSLFHPLAPGNNDETELNSPEVPWWPISQFPGLWLVSWFQSGFLIGRNWLRVHPCKGWDWG